MGRTPAFTDGELRRAMRAHTYRNGDPHINQIAKALGVSGPTVRSRIKSMKLNDQALQPEVLSEAIISVFEVDRQLERINKEFMKIESMTSLTTRERIVVLNSQRELVGQAAKVLETIYAVSAIKEFQDDVLEVLAEVDPDVRERVVEKLERRSAVRRSLGTNPLQARIQPTYLAE